MAEAGDNSQESPDERVSRMIRESRLCMLASHLAWGMWAMYMTSTDKWEEFGYIPYATSRFEEYIRMKNVVCAEGIENLP